MNGGMWTGDIGLSSGLIDVDVSKVNTEVEVAGW